MRIARELPKLEEEKAQCVADLPLRKALAALADPGDVEDTEIAGLHFIDDLLAAIDAVNRKMWEVYDSLYTRTDLKSIQSWIGELTFLVEEEKRLWGSLLQEGEIEKIQGLIAKRIRELGGYPDTVDSGDIRDIFTKLGLSEPFNPNIRPPKDVSTQETVFTRAVGLLFAIRLGDFESLCPKIDAFTDWLSRDEHDVGFEELCDAYDILNILRGKLREAGVLGKGVRASLSHALRWCEMRIGRALNDWPELNQAIDVSLQRQKKFIEFFYPE